MSRRERASRERPVRSRPAHARPTRRRRPARTRLARWYRVLPVAAILLALAICGLVVAAPTTVGRQLLYPVSYAEEIKDSAERYGVDPLLVCAVISCESGWEEDAVSAVGAVGLMQVMPETAESLAALGIVDAQAWDPSRCAEPAVNIEYGCACLSYLQSQLSSQEEVIAAYNAGIGVVQGWLANGGSIPEDIAYAETRAYLERVLAAYEGYQRSYPLGI